MPPGERQGPFSQKPAGVLLVIRKLVLRVKIFGLLEMKLEQLLG